MQQTYCIFTEFFYNEVCNQCFYQHSKQKHSNILFLKACYHFKEYPKMYLVRKKNKGQKFMLYYLNLILSRSYTGRDGVNSLTADVALLQLLV